MGNIADHIAAAIGGAGTVNDKLIAFFSAVGMGTGSPEGVVTAGVGALYMRQDGAAGTTLYTKQTGSGNTGWAAVGGGGGVSHKLTLDTTATNATTSSTSFVDIDATNLPALSLTCAVGDVVEWALTASFGISGTGNVLGLDALITLPNATTTTFRATGSRYAAHAWEGASTGGDVLTQTAKGLFVCTAAGVHSFKPQWRVNTGATGTLLRAAAGTYHTSPLHHVKNFGPVAT